MLFRPIRFFCCSTCTDHWGKHRQVALLSDCYPCFTSTAQTPPIFWGLANCESHRARALYNILLQLLRFFRTSQHARCSNVSLGMNSFWWFLAFLFERKQKNDWKLSKRKIYYELCPGHSHTVDYFKCAFLYCSLCDCWLHYLKWPLGTSSYNTSVVFHSLRFHYKGTFHQMMLTCWLCLLFIWTDATAVAMFLSSIERLTFQNVWCVKCFFFVIYLW